MAPHQTFVLRGQALEDRLAITIPGLRLNYSAMTDAHGYFELRIPCDDLDTHLWSGDGRVTFGELTLSYDFE